VHSFIVAKINGSNNFCLNCTIFVECDEYIGLFENIKFYHLALLVNRTQNFICQVSDFGTENINNLFEVGS
jgi:hypothetical protein